MDNIKAKWHHKNHKTLLMNLQIFKFSSHFSTFDVWNFKDFSFMSESFVVSFYFHIDLLPSKKFSFIVFFTEWGEEEKIPRRFYVNIFWVALAQTKLNQIHQIIAIGAYKIDKNGSW